MRLNYPQSFNYIYIFDLVTETFFILLTYLFLSHKQKKKNCFFVYVQIFLYIYASIYLSNTKIRRRLYSQRGRCSALYIAVKMLFYPHPHFFVFFFSNLFFSLFVPVFIWGMKHSQKNHHNKTVSNET